MALVAAVTLGPSVARAGIQEYETHFQRSPSETVVGYVIHGGSRSGEYDWSFDLGAPSTPQETLAYSAIVDDSADFYIAMTSYNAAGGSSTISNELLVAARQPVPVPVPEPEPEPDPEPVPEPNPGADLPEFKHRLGLTADFSGLVRAIFIDGSGGPLTLDSLAATGDLRPSHCDLDGDGDGDIVLGFGPGSGGTIALLYLENGFVQSLGELVVGDALYHEADGQTYPACGDIDGDELPELVVGMGVAAGLTLVVLDDVDEAYAPYPIGDGGRIVAPASGRTAQLGSALTPALGDIDGDGREELIVGFAQPGVHEITVLDDALAAFAQHPSLVGPTPVLRVARSGNADPEGGGTFPALGDWDGDGRDEIAIGYGAGSGGWVFVLDDAQPREYQAYQGFFAFRAGRGPTSGATGATRPSFGNVDDDAPEELVVSFPGESSHELHVFDDMHSGGLQVFFGGLQFVTASDEDDIWIAAPGH